MFSRDFFGGFEVLIYENKEKIAWKCRSMEIRFLLQKSFYRIVILILQSDSNKWCREGRFGYNWRRFQFKGAIWRYTVWVLTSFWMSKWNLWLYIFHPPRVFCNENWVHPFFESRLNFAGCSRSLCTPWVNVWSVNESSAGSSQEAPRKPP